MKKNNILFLICLLLTSCQKSKDDLANSIINKSFAEMQNAGEEIEIIKIDSLSQAKLVFDETESGVNIKREIDKLNSEISEDLHFLKSWAGIANIGTDLEKVQEKTARVKHLEDSLNTERSRFKFDTTMVMKRIVVKRKERNKIMTDTAFFYFDKQITKCVGVKGKDRGEYQYMELSTPYTK